MLSSTFSASFLTGSSGRGISKLKPSSIVDSLKPSYQATFNINAYPFEAVRIEYPLVAHAKPSRGISLNIVHAEGVVLHAKLQSKRRGWLRVTAGRDQQSDSRTKCSSLTQCRRPVGDQSSRHLKLSDALSTDSCRHSTLQYFPSPLSFHYTKAALHPRCLIQSRYDTHASNTTLQSVRYSSTRKTKIHQSYAGIDPPRARTDARH